jgi:hypothetical protein
MHFLEGDGGLRYEHQTSELGGAAWVARAVRPGSLSA